MTSAVTQAGLSRRSSATSSRVERCRMCRRRRYFFESASASSVASSALWLSRMSECTAASVRPLNCSRRAWMRASSSACTAIRRVPLAKMRSRSSGLFTSRLPVLEPMKILMPQADVTRIEGFEVVRCGADEKAVVGDALLGGAREFLVERRLRGGGGAVFGISRKLVTPPRTAAREPEPRSSLCSLPGSRKCTCASITPGSSSLPPASIVSRAAAVMLGSMRAMRPSSQATSPSKVVPSGRAMRVLRMSRLYNRQTPEKREGY